MSKEITKAIILQEIQDKFKLREFTPAAFLFDETVVPVYNIEPHLKQFLNDYEERSVTGTGALYMTKVPFDEVWVLHRYDVVFVGAGAYTVAGVYTMRDLTSPTKYCYLDLTAGQSTSYHVDLPQPVIMHPEDRIYVNIDGYTSTQDIRLYYDYTMEKIR